MDGDRDNARITMPSYYMSGESISPHRRPLFLIRVTGLVHFVFEGVSGWDDQKPE
jgi:hypothetical protein